MVCEYYLILLSHHLGYDLDLERSYFQSHPDGYDVNLRCLDDYPIEQFEIVSFDGAHWEDQIDRIRDRYS
jgi:hypothetical protein